MSGYIYQVKQCDIQLGEEEQTRLQTTRKYEATKFLEAQIIIDPYEFMKIDLGEL
jgi:hypothetical protein